mmetsp:Transcript_8538/g.36181  ORF Transcript_8538/g.36181 Transcript_8538/m.36181 type:complete len:318 (-) Transcript_8538:270-1223(-)
MCTPVAPIDDATHPPALAFARSISTIASRSSASADAETERKTARCESRAFLAADVAAATSDAVATPETAPRSKSFLDATPQAPFDADRVAASPTASTISPGAEAGLSPRAHSGPIPKRRAGSPPPPPSESGSVASFVALAGVAPGHGAFATPASRTPGGMPASRRNVHAATTSHVLNVHPFRAWCRAITKGSLSCWSCVSFVPSEGDGGVMTAHRARSPRSVSPHARQHAAILPSFWCVAAGSPSPSPSPSKLYALCERSVPLRTLCASTSSTLATLAPRRRLSNGARGGYSTSSPRSDTAYTSWSTVCCGAARARN